MLLVDECQHMSHLAHLWVSNIQIMHLDCDLICDTNYMLAFNAYIITLNDAYCIIKLICARVRPDSEHARLHNQTLSQPRNMRESLIRLRPHM